MKQMVSLAVLGMAVMLLFGAEAFASPADIDAKIAEQRTLIDNAVGSGSLTKYEAKIVWENLKGIRERKRAAYEEGRLDQWEEANIQNMLDRNMRMITDKGNNPVRRFNRPEITHRFVNQQNRIDNGIQTGALTKREAARLQENLDRAKAKYAELTRDGRFTHAEEERMHELLDRDSEIIWRKKHD